jgi:type VI protein secretion system component Hcp
MGRTSRTFNTQRQILPHVVHPAIQAAVLLALSSALFWIPAQPSHGQITFGVTFDKSTPKLYTLRY